MPSFIRSFQSLIFFGLPFLTRNTIVDVYGEESFSKLFIQPSFIRPASEKFWELEKRIKEDKRHPGVVMELKKSEVIWDIVRLIRLKVITYDDLSDFSDELQNEVKRILEMSR